MRSALLLGMASAVLRVSFAAGPDDLPFQLSSSLPPDVLSVLEKDTGAKRYALVAHLNPAAAPTSAHRRR